MFASLCKHDCEAIFSGKEHYVSVMRAFNFLATILSFSRADDFDEENKEHMLLVLQLLIKKVERYNNRPFVTCLGGVELAIYGCLNAHSDGIKWRKCSKKFGHVMEEMRQHCMYGEETFVCPELPKDESFLKKNWATILGGGLGMVALPGDRKHNKKFSIS